MEAKSNKIAVLRFPSSQAVIPDNHDELILLKSNSDKELKK